MTQLKLPDFAGAYKLLTECSALYDEVISASFSLDQRQEKLLSLHQKYLALLNNCMREYSKLLRLPDLSFGLTTKNKETKSS